MRSTDQMVNCQGGKNIQTALKLSISNQIRGKEASD